MYRLISLMLVFGFLSGCVNPQLTSRTARTSVEQLLLTQAVSKSLPNSSQSDFPLSPGATVKIDLTGLTEDRKFLGAAIEGWLGEKGFLVRKADETATYRLHILVNAFGTEYGESFLGMPSIQSTFIPFALPEITVFRSQRQFGRVQYSMNIFEEQTGKLVNTLKTREGQTFHRLYTILFFFSYLDTNLDYIPE
jgi:hypothetical protein